MPSQIPIYNEEKHQCEVCMWEFSQLRLPKCRGFVISFWLMNWLVDAFFLFYQWLSISEHLSSIEFGSTRKCRSNQHGFRKFEKQIW